jgi:hypothetical protein
MADDLGALTVRMFVVRFPDDGMLLGTIELTGDGPAGQRYIARLRNLEGGIEGRVYSGDDETEARAAIDDAIESICAGAALWRERRASVLH